MTTATLVTSATFTQIAKQRILPSRDQLLGSYILGASQAESVKNRANPALPLTVQGSPTYNAHSAVIRSSSSAGYGFQTGITPDEDYTLFLIRKNGTTGGAAPEIAGMADDPTGTLWSFREHDTNNYGSAGEGAAVGTTGSAYRAKPAAGTIYFEAIAHTPLDYTKYYYGLAGVLNTAANAAAGVSTSRRSSSNTPKYSQLLIGTTGLTDTITTNTCEVYAFAAYNRVLSQVEVAAAYAAYVAYYAALSVTVV